MECKDCNALLIEHWRGELDGAQEAALREHWRRCANCGEEARALGVLWRGLEWQSQPDAAVMRELETSLSRIPGALGEERPARATPWFQRLWPARPGMALAYSLCLLASGIVLGDGFRPLGRLREVQDLDARIAAGRLEASDLSPDSLVRLCAVPLQNDLETL